MATEVQYLDPNQQTQTGYIGDDGKTYKDENCTERIDVGSIVVAGDGKQYILTDKGGMLLSDYYKSLYGPPYGGGNSRSYYHDLDKDYINRIYKAQLKADEDRLKSVYDQNVGVLNAAGARIPGAYNDAKNQVAAQSETQRANFNEYAAASGLNSGAGGQAVLSFGNQLQGDLADLNKAQADAIADIDLQLAQLKSQYQSDLAQAFAQGDLDKARALYESYQRNRSA